MADRWTADLRDNRKQMWHQESLEKWNQDGEGSMLDPGEERVQVQMRDTEELLFLLQSKGKKKSES